MANTLGFYNPAFYASEALVHLRKSLGMAGRVHIGFDSERRTFGLGDTINIRRPSVFTAQSAPGAAADVATESVSISLSSHKEVRFAVTDKELAYTGQRIVDDHIAPAAYALADDVDQSLTALTYQVPWYVKSAASTAAVADILNVRETMFGNKVPLRDERNIHFMVGGSEEADLLALSAFSQWQGAGSTGEQTQMTGQLGKRFGFNFFANQNRVSAGAYTNLTDLAGALNGAAAKGASSITVDAFAAGGEAVLKGTQIKITTSGTDYYYAVTADVTLTGGAGTISISPPARVAHSDNDVVTVTTDFDNLSAAPQALAFHKDAFALAFAKLPDFSGMNANLGLNIASVQDPVTGLAVRSRIAYDNTNSQIQVVLDVLYGVKTLNPDLACRLITV